ncbi:hypothetical protein AcV7_002418 [Taiwanofungus camphoratus]|nr:hypothetical protein AcV7_002418 [Antrodia cinnamomea]
MEGIIISGEDNNTRKTQGSERDDVSIVSYEGPTDVGTGTDIFDTRREAEQAMEMIIEIERRETRKSTMKDLEEAMERAAEILGQMSSHAEFTPSILEKATIIAQRLTPEIDNLTGTGPLRRQTQKVSEKNSKKGTSTGTEHLAQIAASLVKLTTRMDQIEMQLSIPAPRLAQGEVTNKHLGDNRKEALGTEATETKRPAQTVSDSLKIANTRATARPIIPKPRNATAELSKGKILPTNPLAAHHPSRLIVEIQDGLPEGKRSKEAITVQDINERLQKHEDSKHLQVVNIKYNPQNNCIVFVRTDQRATELIPFADRFTDLIAGDQATQVRADRPWYKVQVNGVSTWNQNTHDIPTPEEIHQELVDNNPDYARMEILQLPRWMRHPSDLKTLFYSSVVIALANQDDAEHLVKRLKNLAIAGSATTAGSTTTRVADAKTVQSAACVQVSMQRLTIYVESAQQNTATMQWT